MEIDSSKIKKDTEQRMQKSIESMKGNLNTVRTGRAK
jgi:ribosome recycling factor